MSEVMNVSIVRFRFKQIFESANDMYNFIIKYLDEPDDCEMESVWDGTHYVDTGKVEYFKYSETEHSYNVKHDLNNPKIWYLDYHLSDTTESCDDTYSNVPISALNEIIQRTHQLFPDMLDEAHIITYEWYTGCDEPTYY